MPNTTRWALLPSFTALALVTLTLGAQAQLSAAQQNALKSNCRSDFMSKCSGVRPGGQEALACLQKNVASLSAACKGAVSATLPPPAPAAAAKPAEAAKPVQAAKPPEAPPAPAAPAAAAPVTPAPQPARAPAAPKSAPPPKAAIAAPPKTAKPAAATAAAAPTAAQQNAMKQACTSDFMAKCRGVQPGGKDALTCLQKNVGTLSANCKQAVSSTMSAPVPVAAAPAAAPAPAPAAAVSPQQLKAVQFTCRNDFRRYCKGVQAGGPAALGCLQNNARRLTPDCKTSLAAVADAIPEGAAMPAPTPASVAPARQPQRATIIDAAVMLRACKLDLVRHCRGVKPGGGRELACLTANQSNLSVRCKTAMKVTSPLR